MADLIVTITETATDLAGDDEISDTVVRKISGITSLYHYKGKANALYGDSHRIFSTDSALNIGNGGGIGALVYLRITNLESSSTEWQLKVYDSGGNIIYTNIAVNESFIFFPMVGFIYQMDSQDTGGSGVTIHPGETLDRIEVYSDAFDGNHYEIYCAFAAGNV